MKFKILYPLLVHWQHLDKLVILQSQLLAGTIG